MCWVRYLITSLKTYLTCMQYTLAVLILSSRLALHSTDFQAFCSAGAERTQRPAFWCKQVLCFFQEYKVLRWCAPFLWVFCSAHLLGSSPSPMVYPHGTNPVAFQQLSTLATQGFAAGLALMYLRQLKHKSLLPLVKSCTMKQNTWNKIPKAVLFLFHEALILLV